MELDPRARVERLAGKVRAVKAAGTQGRRTRPAVVLGDPRTREEWRMLRWALEGFPGAVYVVATADRNHPEWRATTGRPEGGGFRDLDRERDQVSFWAEVCASGDGYVPVLFFPGNETAEFQARLALELDLKVAVLLERTGEEPPALGDVRGALLPLPLDQAILWNFFRGPAPRLEPGLVQRLGRLVHESYVKARREEGAPPDPSLVPWEDLAPDLQDSNCRQAEDMLRKLELLGWRIVPIAEGGQGLDLAEGDVEWLAVMEHGRWVMERLLAGWRWGSLKDVAAKRSPYLVPFLELDESNREKDRQAVRRIPDLLEAGGYGVQRPPADSGSGGPGNRRWFRWIRTAWPLVLAFLFLAVFVLGVEGFRRNSCEDGADQSCPLRQDHFYQAIQLFGLEYGGGSSPNGFLAWARFLAPLVALATAVAAFLDLFYQRLRLFVTTLRKGHVVICGLGETGYALAERYRKKGEKVVAVELDGENDYVPPVRTLGAAVIVGDAMEDAVLEIARVPQARLVVTATGDGATNLAVAKSAAAMVRQPDGGLSRIIAHVPDDLLMAFFRGSTFCAKRSSATGETRDLPPVACVNLFDHAAERLVRDLDFRKAEGTHLAIVGAGRMGRSLLVRAAHAWFWRHWWDPREDLVRNPGPRLRITMVDREASRLRDLLQRRYPALKEVTDLEAIDADVETAAFYDAFLGNLDSRLPPSRVFVCLGNDTHSLLTAKVVDDLLGPMFPAMSTMVMLTGLGGVARLAEKESGRGPGIRFFGLREEVCAPEVFEDAPFEGIAREFHEIYLRHEMGEHRYNPARPSHQPWCRLPAGYRRSNHRLARHVPKKLERVCCTLVPRFDWMKERFRFDPEEVEELARMEHERWRAEDAGPGHPAAVDWGRLPEIDQERARYMIRQHPLVLAKAGFDIQRIARVPRFLPG